MVARVKLEHKAESEHLDAHVRKVSSGSILLDKVLGGGWALGRVVNIVGDRSAGKTLLAIEAAANFAFVVEKRRYIRYAEAEAAFDRLYGSSIGMPDGVKFVGGEDDRENRIDTVEKFHADLREYLAMMKKTDSPGLYVLDSLDALSDNAEMKREIGDAATYGAEKAKSISKLFRQEIGGIEAALVTVFIISQIRDNIGVMFGEKSKRSGGKALDFYASQVLWLTELQKIKRMAHGVERVVGVQVLCRTKKNKVAMPFRDCKVNIMFNYGVDDETSMIDWLKDVKAITPKEATEKRATLEELRKSHAIVELRRFKKALRISVDERWDKIEDALKPHMSKYGSTAA